VFGDVVFAELVHARLDVEEPTGWVHLQAVLSVPYEGGACTVVDLSATDEAGVILQLPAGDREEFSRRFIDAFQRRGHRGFQQAR
jgi:hypothetical protein